MDTSTLPPTAAPTVPLAVPGTVPFPIAPEPATGAPEPATGAPAVPDRLRLARLVVLLELLVALVSTVESTVVAGTGLGTPGAVLATALLAAVLARQSGRLGRGRVTRTLRVTQWLFLGMAALDQVVALVVVQGALLPLSVAVRVVLPLAVLVLTQEHRPAGIRRTRRLRREAAAGAR